MPLNTPITPLTDAQKTLVVKNQIASIPQNAASIASQKLSDLTNTLIGGINDIWDSKDRFGNPINPQDVLTAYKTNAATAFQISSNTAAYIIEQAPLVFDTARAEGIIAAINATLAKVKPVTVHQDGSITVN